jgi:hypothetical protein
MISVNEKILVRVDMSQKDFAMVGGVEMKTAIKYETNYREKSPVLATVVSGNDWVNEGEVLICHHNHFYTPSPYHLEDDLFSIPFNKTIFAKVSSKGNLTAICGNILGERVQIKTQFDLPPEMQKTYIDRLLITDKGWTTFKNGTTVLCKPHAPYDICYTWGGEARVATKISMDMVIGFIKSS